MTEHSSASPTLTVGHTHGHAKRLTEGSREVPAIALCVRLSPLVFTVVVLEVASGLPYGLVQELAPLWLRTHGVTLAQLSLAGLVGLPWTLKALWAPLVDRFGTYRRWIAAGMLGCILGSLALAAVAREAAAPHLGLALFCLTLVAFSSATQDVALDGWMAAVTPETERGHVTGVRVGAYRAAMALSGGGAAVIGARWGWDMAFFAAAACLALTGLVVTRAPVPAPGEDQPGADWLRELRDWLLQPSSWALFAFMLLYKLGDAAMAPMTRPFLLQTGLDAGQVGMLSSTAGAVLVGAGALVGGGVLTRLGLRRGAWWLGGLQALSNLGYAGAASLGTVPAAIGATLAESFCTGLGTAASLAIVLEASSGGGGRQAATRFAALTTLAGLTRSLAGAVSGFGVERWGYAPWFACTFLFALPALALIPRVTRTRAETVAAAGG
jgi:PAT family beta-lactamase induction signal transducer AmpG